MQAMPVVILRELVFNAVQREFTISDTVPVTTDQPRSDCHPRSTSHDWMIPAAGRKRVDNDLAACTITSL